MIPVKRLLKSLLYLLIAFLFASPIILLSDSVSNPVTMRENLSAANTAYTSRVQGEHITDLSLKVTEMRFGPEDEPPPFLVVAPEDDPVAGILALRLCAPTVGGGLVLLPTSPPLGPGVLSRMQDTLAAGDTDSHVIALGTIHPDILSEIAAHFGVQTLEGNAAQLAIQVDEWMVARNGVSERYLFIPEEDVRHGLALASWLALTGDPVFPIGRDELSEHLRDYLSVVHGQARGRQNNLYLIAPTSLGTAALMEELNNYGQVVRVAGITPEETALALAQYYDSATQFGWWAGAIPEGNRHYLLGNPDHPAELIAAAPLFSETQYGPTVLTSSERLTSVVETFLWTIRPHWINVPSEGRYNFAWLAGNSDVISWSVQNRVDLINQTVPYDSQGFGGLDSSLLIWLTIGWIGAVWTWIHSVMRRPTMEQHVRLFWVLITLVLGPLGLLSYYLATRGEKPPVAIKEMLSPPTEALSATAATVSLATSMILITGFMYVLFRRPLFLIDGSLFFLGNPAVRSLLVGSLLALAAALFLVEPVLYATGGESYGKLLTDTWKGPAIALTITAVLFSLIVWWLRTHYLSIPPRETQILWWGTAALAAALTAIITYPINYWIVSQNVKKGVLG